PGVGKRWPGQQWVMPAGAEGAFEQERLQALRRTRHLQRRLLSAQLLVPGADQVTPVRVKLDHGAAPPRLLGPDPAAPRPAERIEAEPAGGEVVEDRAPEQLQRLLRRVPGRGVLVTAAREGRDRGRGLPDRRLPAAALPVRRRAPPDRIPAALVLPLVVT